MLINIGYDNYVETRLVVAVLTAVGSAAKHLRRNHAERGRLVDATAGHRTRSLILTHSYVLLCSLKPETARERLDRPFTKQVNN